MKKTIAAVVLLCGALGLAGCASPEGYRETPATTVSPDPNATTTTTAPPEDSWAEWDKEGPRTLRRKIGSYFRNRSLDFWDMFDVSLAGGKWAKVEVDYLIGFYGFGATEAQRWRLGQRSAIANEETTMICSLPFPASLIFFPTMLGEEKGDKSGTILTMGGISYESEKAIWPDPVARGIPQTQTRVRMTFLERDTQSHRFRVTGNSFGIGAEAHLLVGARAKVYPLQIFDFIAGIFGWDLVGDDVKPYDPWKP